MTLWLSRHQWDISKVSDKPIEDAKSGRVKTVYGESDELG